ncbi:phosphomannomutase [Mesorhizobium sp. 10J20-29]
MTVSNFQGSSLRFGTSGLRGLVSDLTDETVRLYARAFLTYINGKNEILNGRGGIGQFSKVLVGRDLRSSSPSIVESCLAGVQDMGLDAICCGALPTPALALHAMSEKCPAIMVTGSHIPDDRNGLKFYSADGEIDKNDEKGIAAALVRIRRFEGNPPLANVKDSQAALRNYVNRYTALSPSLSLNGMRIGIYQHSSVSRDILVEILQKLGAETVTRGRSDVFVPVDTEALDERDIKLAKDWSKQFGLDAMVSTDGDGDRPLIADEHGDFLRGDIVGLLTAKFLEADIVVTPLTSTSSVEKSCWFEKVVRSRVGSPYVLEHMYDCSADAGKVVVGFEANGGVMLGTDVDLDGITMKALPTRDALLPIIAVLSLAHIRKKNSLARLVGDLPSRFTASGRLENIPPSPSMALLELIKDDELASLYVAELGSLEEIDDTDGVQLKLTSGERIHYRASGNAPEMRCYVEAASPERASELLRWGLDKAHQKFQDGGYL